MAKSPAAKLRPLYWSPSWVWRFRSSCRWLSLWKPGGEPSSANAGLRAAPL